MEELNKRKVRRDKNNIDLENAKEEGDEEKILQFSKRSVKVTREQNEECKKLLTLLGVPYIDAPSEAVFKEAQCAEICKGSPKLVRNFSASEASKKLIREFTLEKILSELELNKSEFLDMCILFGCDYCPTIKQIGAKKAYELIKKYKNIEKIVKVLIDKKKKYVLPCEDYLERVKITRELFNNPKVIPYSKIDNIKWKDPDEEGLMEYLVKEKQFDEKKIANVIDRIKKTRKTSQQGRISDFFNKKDVNEKDKKEIEKKKLEKKKAEKKKKDAEKRELLKKKKGNMPKETKDKKRKNTENDVNIKKKQKFDEDDIDDE